MDLNKMYNSFQKIQEEQKIRQEKNMWKNAYKSDDMKSCLDPLTKSDLNKIKQTLSLPIKTNLTKEELLSSVKNYYFYNIKNYLAYFTYEHFKDLDKILENEKNITLDYRLIRYYLKAGLVFPVTKNNEHVLIIPKEIRTILNEFKIEQKDVIKRNTEILKSIRGLLIYYGVIDRYTLINMLNSFLLMNNVDIYKFNQILEVNINSHPFFKMNDTYIYYDDLDNNQVTRISREQISKGIDFYPINKIRALQASENLYIEKTPQVVKLMNYLMTNYLINNSELESVMYHIIISIKKGENFNNVVQELSKRFEFESLEHAQIMVGMLQEIHNNTRMWSLKGHTPTELGGKKSQSDLPNIEKKQEIIPKKKVGRNEPCPCGSGKKYKHCCIDN